MPAAGLKIRTFSDFQVSSEIFISIPSQNVTLKILKLKQIFEKGAILIMLKLNLSIDLSNNANVALRLFDTMDFTLKSNEFKGFDEMPVVYESVNNLHSGKNKLSFDVVAPKLWSAEIPNLYTLYIEIFDGEDFT